MKTRRTDQSLTSLSARRRNGSGWQRLTSSKIIAIVLFCTASVMSAPAQSAFFSTIVNFNGNDGANPGAALILASDGNFYGTTVGGGPDLAGTIFKTTASGMLTSLHSFRLIDGDGPTAALLQGSDGNFYGITQGGGPNPPYSNGTVFQSSASGGLTTLYTFCDQNGCPQGCEPAASLIEGNDGNYYGTTMYGPAQSCYLSPGSIFRITPSGTLTTLYAFNGSDGYIPTAALVLASDGNFYGTTSEGGTGSYGTVFRITPGGILTTLYNFSGPDGANVFASLTQASDESFYGTTYGGGASGNGTIYRITRNGNLTILYSFCVEGPTCTDGANPYVAPIRGADGNFYGTTKYGGAFDANCHSGCGTVYRITPAGELTTLHRFGSDDGANPAAALVLGRDGNFYGTTINGGSGGLGTIFRLGTAKPCATCRLAKP